MQEIKNIVGAANFITDASSLDEAATSWRDGKFGSAIAIIRPANLQELSKVVAYCALHKINIVTQGGKTSLSAGSVPTGADNQVILQTIRMDKISAPDIANKTIEVEAGVTLHKANDYLKSFGFKIPLGLGIGGVAQLGGNIATNAGGTEAFRYGNAGELVSAMTVVLPRAEENIFTPTRNNFADFVGTEGIFGIIANATFKLEPLPVKKQVAFITVDSLQHLKDLKTQLHHFAPKALNAIERIDRRAFQLALERIAEKGEAVTDIFSNYISEFNFLIEIDSAHENDDLKTKMQNAVNAFAQIDKSAKFLICNEAQAAELWKIRTVNISEGIRSYCARTNNKTVAFDLSLPLADAGIFPTQELLQQLGEVVKDVDYIQFGHSGNNGLHFNLVVGEATTAKQISQLKHIVYDHIVKRHGNISAEHGIGQTKRLELAKYYPEIVAGLKAKKQHYDPLGILNRGKVI